MTVELPGGLIDAMAPVVAGAIPTLVAAIPPRGASALGQFSVHDRYSNKSEWGGLLDEVRASAREAVYGLALAPPPELLAHHGLEHKQRLLRTLRELAMVTFMLRADGARAEPREIPLGPLGEVRDLIEAAVPALAGHPEIAPLLHTRAVTEPELTAEHGAAHFALALATAATVLRSFGAVHRDLAMAVDLAAEAGAQLLSTTPPPAGYEAALLANIRRDYRYDNMGGREVSVRNGTFALAEGFYRTMRAVYQQFHCAPRLCQYQVDHSPVEGLLPGRAPDFSGNGLVTQVDGVVVIRAGSATGFTEVGMHVLDAEPAAIDFEYWDEIVDISWTATEGYAVLVASTRPDVEHVRVASPPWPGDYRIRVCARRRGRRYEEHCVELWPAPLAPEVSHKHTDRLGLLLRGEPVPSLPEDPEDPYQWFGARPAATTITVLTGGYSVEEALAAFGADLGTPLTETDLEEQEPGFVVTAWRAGDVLLVRDNGFHGSQPAVLAPLSLRGRAASWSWYEQIGRTQLCFCWDGDFVAVVPRGRRVRARTPKQPQLRGVLDGLDFRKAGPRFASGMTALERFTGRHLREDDFERPDPIYYPLSF